MHQGRITLGEIFRGNLPALLRDLVETAPGRQRCDIGLDLLKGGCIQTPLRIAGMVSAKP